METQNKRKPLPACPRVDVQVTRELIRNSTRKDSGGCMIADAVKLARPDARFVSADIQTIRFSENGFRYAYLTPRKGQVALIKFDQGEEDIEPFTFQLRTGQTTRRKTARDKTLLPRPRTEKQRAATEKAAADSTKPPRGKIKLVHVNGDGVPDIRGGQVPPLAPLAGGDGVPKSRRRQYGLRAMDR